METRLLILNFDPVFQDRALAMFDAMRKVETRIVRTLAEAVCILMREDFDLFIVEGDAAVAIEQTIHTRQHFPSLKIICLPQDTVNERLVDQASEQNIELITTELQRSPASSPAACSRIRL